LFVFVFFTFVGWKVKIVFFNSEERKSFMPQIHVNTDLLLQLGGLFRQLNGQIHEQIKPQLQVLTTRLESDWQGQSRASYDQLFSEWNIQLDDVTRRGDELGQYLQEMATRFTHVNERS